MSHVCVVGLGYIGFPTACVLADAGHGVTGVDVNPEIVAQLQSGQCHFEEPGLPDLFRRALDRGNLKFSTRVVPADSYIIAVPTPATHEHEADLTYVVSAVESLVPYLRRGTLVVIESTVPPGVADQVVSGILAQSGLKVGTEVFVAHAPERVIPGRTIHEIIHNDRIVGGINDPSTNAAEVLYRSFVKGRLFLTDARTAEMVKLMENTFRDVNIALANEFALIAEDQGIDAWEAISLANCHPRVSILRPGPGVGGHCIAVDPWFLVEKSQRLARLISTARAVNDSMPDYVRQRVKRLCSPGAKVCILGLAYKAETGDLRESPAIEIAEGLRADGYEVAAYDPYVVDSAFQVGSVEESVQGAELILLLTDHKVLAEVDPVELRKLVDVPVVFDTRNALNAQRWTSAGFEFHRLGTRRKVNVSVAQEVAAAVEQ